MQVRLQHRQRGTWLPYSGDFRPVKPDQTTGLDMSFHKTATPRDVAQLAGVRSKCRYHKVTFTSKTVTIQNDNGLREQYRFDNKAEYAAFREHFAWLTASIF